MLNSPVDIAIVAGVILLLFGPKKVPELGRALGQGIGNFKRALTDAGEEVKAGIKAEEEKAAAAAAAATKADESGTAAAPAESASQVAEAASKASQYPADAVPPA